MKMLLSFIAMVCIISSLNGCRSATPTQVTPTAPASTETVTQKPEPKEKLIPSARSEGYDSEEPYRCYKNAFMKGSWNKENADMLVEAARKGDLERVKELLRIGTDPNGIREPSEIQFVISDNPMFVDRRTKIRDNAYNMGGVTVNIPPGASIIPVRGGETPLSEASSSGHLEIVKVLLESGANINQRGCVCRSTALIAASLAGRNDVVRFLLSQRADASIQNCQGETAVAAALRQGHQQVVETLKTYKQD